MVLQDPTAYTPLEQGKTVVPHPMILVVEDHLGTQEMLSWWLDQNPALPQAILLDLWMPVLDGRQFLSALHLHQGQPLPPVILLTAERGDGAQLACESLLLKPFHLCDLRACLQQITTRNVEEISG